MDLVACIIAISVVLLVMDSAILVAITDDSEEAFTIFNPVRNYEQWDAMNWFGVGVVTLLLNVIFIPCSIFYWVYKIIEIVVYCIYWLFTVGRR